MKVQIYTSIDQPELIEHWNRIVRENDYFAQSDHSWCAPWWRHRKENRELYVVCVIEGKDRIVGIAPLCIEKVIGCRILRSFPIHFADFYTFLIDPQYDPDEIFQNISEHIKSFKNWDFIRIDQINSNDSNYGRFLKSGYTPAPLCDIVVSEIEVKTFDDFLMTLKRKQRGDIRRRMRILEKEFRVSFEVIDCFHDYMEHFDEMVELYNKRWEGLHLRELSDPFFDYRNEAISEAFNHGRMRLYLLKTDNRVIAYLHGFIQHDTFYYWKVCHDTSFSKYSPGILITAYAIRHMIENLIYKLNFMTGNYDWKTKWGSNTHTSENATFFLSRPSIRGYLLRRYHLKWRDKLKAVYNAYDFHRKIIYLKKLTGRKS